MAETGTRRAARSAVDGLALAVTGAGMLAAVLMVSADFLPIVSVDVAGGSCGVINDTSPELADGCEQSGFDRHGPALVLLALVVATMAWGAGLGGSRAGGRCPPCAGRGGAGDRPADRPPGDRRTGAIGPRFDGAEAQAETGFTLELVAGALAAVAGTVRLLRRAPWHS